PFKLHDPAAKNCKALPAPTAVAEGSERHIQFRCTSFDGGLQGVIGDVTVPHSRFVIGVTQHTAHGEQIDPRVEHKKNCRLSKVLGAHVMQEGVTISVEKGKSPKAEIQR
uniref:hypothetical protein n=1 Tax=Blastomonas sp. TaxID=1909299 RepID=UPI0035940C39